MVSLLHEHERLLRQGLHAKFREIERETDKELQTARTARREYEKQAARARKQLKDLEAGEC